MFHGVEKPLFSPTFSTGGLGRATGQFNAIYRGDSADSRMISGRYRFIHSFHRLYYNYYSINTYIYGDDNESEHRTRIKRPIRPRFTGNRTSWKISFYFRPNFFSSFFGIVV